jgi:drug/metabolite transporter (DMT)-like permease
MKLRDVLELLLLSAIWGASFLLISIAVRSFPPPWVALLRLTFGSALLWAVLLARGRKLPPARLIVPLVLVAFLNNAVPFVLFPLGERVVPSNIAAVLNATTPIWALLLSIAFLGQRAEGSAVPGVVIGFLGVVLVVFSQSGTAPHASGHDYLVGVFIIALASASYAAATVLAKSRLVGLDPIGLATTQLTLAGVMVLPVALFGERPASIHPASLAAAITLGVLGSGLAYLLFYSLLDRVSSTQVVSVTYLGPIWGIFWGKIAHEKITPAAYLGVGIVIAGLILLNRTPNPGPGQQRASDWQKSKNSERALQESGS